MVETKIYANCDDNEDFEIGPVLVNYYIGVKPPTDDDSDYSTKKSSLSSVLVAVNQEFHKYMNFKPSKKSMFFRGTDEYFTGTKGTVCTYEHWWKDALGDAWTEDTTH